MKEALAQWHSPDAADTMAERILECVQRANPAVSRTESGTAFVQRPAKRANGVAFSLALENETHPRPLPGGERVQALANSSTTLASRPAKTSRPARNPFPSLGGARGGSSGLLAPLTS
jgi:hypothetical protein